MPASTRPHLIDATMFWNASGGSRRYVAAKRQWLQRHTDWRHTVATPLPDMPGSLRVPSLPLPGSGGAYRWAWRRHASSRQLMDAKPDLIESGDPYRLAWSSLDAARACGVPVIAFCHSNLERMAMLAAGRYWRPFLQQAVRRYAVKLYNRFDAVLAPSAAMCAHLTDWGVRNVVHQPLGVDTSVFHPARCSPRWRQQLGLPSGARLLVYAGRFAPEKNLDLLAATVKKLGAPYWLIAVGAGTAPPQGDRIIVVPTISAPTALATILASADLFVHTGTQETFGLSVLEAMSCGTPVVCSAAEGLGENVDANVGFALPDLTVSSLAEAIVDAFERGAPALGAAARRRAEKCDWAQVLPSLWQIYGRLVRESGKLSR